VTAFNQCAQSLGSFTELFTLLIKAQLDLLGGGATTPSTPSVLGV